MLVPPCLVPHEGGVLATPRYARSAIARGGDLDLPLESGKPDAPRTCEAIRLEESDFVSASTIIKELVASSDVPTASPSVSGLRSPVFTTTNDGSAMASSPSGDPTLKCVMARPLWRTNSKTGPHL